MVYKLLYVVKYKYVIYRLIIGFMLASMLLSMWISNTATTTMLIPIVEAVLQELKKHYIEPHSGAYYFLRKYPIIRGQL